MQLTPLEGTGKASRQRSIVQGHIDQGVIFPKMGIAMSESMNKLIHTTSQTLKSKLRAILATISALSLVLIDEDARRYFKQSEIVLCRQAPEGVEAAQRQAKEIQMS